MNINGYKSKELRMPTSKENRFLRILLETFKEDAERHFLQNGHQNEATADSNDSKEDMSSVHTPDTL